MQHAKRQVKLLEIHCFKIFITALCVTFLMTAVITFELARKAVHADEANCQDNAKCLLVSFMCQNRSLIT